jgi:hypothetical protein
MSGLTRALLILGLIVLAGGISALALMDRRKSVRRAESAVATLCSQAGLLPIEVGASELSYFRDYPRVGSPLRLAAGRLDGFHTEVCFVPIVKRSSIGKTMVGMRCPEELRVEVGLSKRDAASGITHSLLGQPNGVGAKSGFGDYDAWGPAADLQRIFTSEILAKTLAFPRKLDQVMVYGRDIVLVWKDIESDASVVKTAVQLGASLCDLARLTAK